MALGFSFEPSVANNVFVPDNLIAGSFPLVTDTVTLATGQNLTRGALIGRQSLGTATSAVKASGANTGNGTLVMDATTPVLPNAHAGLYTARVTVAAANAATFRVTDPFGVVLGDIAYSGSGASVTLTDQIKFAVTDGATDFIVGDGFDITVAAGAGNYVLAASAAVDGSALPANWVILAEDTNATGGAVTCPVYLAGEFDTNYITFGTGITAASARVSLLGAATSIFLRIGALSNVIV